MPVHVHMHDDARHAVSLCFVCVRVSLIRPVPLLEQSATHATCSYFCETPEQETHPATSAGGSRV